MFLVELEMFHLIVNILLYYFAYQIFLYVSKKILIYL